MHLALHDAVALVPGTLIAASCLLLGSCLYRGPTAGPLAHVVVDKTRGRGASLEFCTLGGWKEVPAETTVPVAGVVKVRAHAADVARQHNRNNDSGTAVPGCAEAFTFHPVEGLRYKFTWKAPREGCLVALLRRPESWTPPPGPASAESKDADSWIVDDTVGGATERCE